MKLLLIGLFLLISLTLTAQDRFGISLSAGKANIIAIKSGRIGSRLYSFQDGISIGLSPTFWHFRPSGWVFVSGLESGILSCRTIFLMTNNKYTESFGRITLPIRVYYFIDNLAGGFLGVDNSLNFPIKKTPLSFLSSSVSSYRHSKD